MQDLVTIDTIIDFLRKCVEEKTPLPPSIWLDAAMKMTVFLEDEHDKLFELESEVANARYEKMTEGDTAAKAKAFVETTDAYLSLRKQKARIERIEELVRLAKVQARMRDTGMQLT